MTIFSLSSLSGEQLLPVQTAIKWFTACWEYWPLRLFCCTAGWAIKFVDGVVGNLSCVAVIYLSALLLFCTTQSVAMAMAAASWHREADRTSLTCCNGIIIIKHVSIAAAALHTWTSCSLVPISRSGVGAIT